LFRVISRIVLLVFLAAVVRWTQTATSVSSSAFDAATCTYSSLWGVKGEKWTLESRLPDFSYAGYHAGETPVPTPAAKWDLKRDFHAAGDGQTDDSDALLKAIESVKTGVLFIPKGTYVISKRIDISNG